MTKSAAAAAATAVVRMGLDGGAANSTSTDIWTAVEEAVAAAAVATASDQGVRH